MERRVALYIAFGGICGAATRWGLGEVIDPDSNWPWAVFVANLAGAFLLGVLTTRFELTSAPVAVAATTGFCGSLTTFSTFAVDIALFLRDDRLTLAVSYLVASLAVGLLCFVLGGLVVSRSRVNG